MDPGPVAGQSRRWVRALVPASGLLLATACATPVGVDPITPEQFQREITANALTAGVPSPFSDQVLRRLNLRERLPLSWKVLLSGHAAEYVYERGRLDTSLPFEELQRRSRINDAARAADRAPDFSRRIREGLPSLGGGRAPGP